ncbi:hypothetical protein QFZ96_000969 [Paraburkholderia youngii]
MPYNYVVDTMSLGIQRQLLAFSARFFCEADCRLCGNRAIVTRENVVHDCLQTRIRISCNHSGTPSNGRVLGRVRANYRYGQHQETLW